MKMKPKITNTLYKTFASSSQHLKRCLEIMHYEVAHKKNGSERMKRLKWNQTLYIRCTRPMENQLPTWYDTPNQCSHPKKKPPNRPELKRTKTETE